METGITASFLFLNKFNLKNKKKIFQQQKKICPSNHAVQLFGIVVVKFINVI